jgi:hypothetical protein
MTSGLTTVIATPALSGETPTKETRETAETHVEKLLKRLWVRIGETLKRLRSISAGRWRLLWVSGGRKWVLGSSEAVNVACFAIFDPSTNSAVSRQPESTEKIYMGLYGPPPSIYHAPMTKYTKVSLRWLNWTGFYSVDRGGRLRFHRSIILRG